MNPPEHEVRWLLKRHMEYVNKYVLRSESRDEAYYCYAIDSFPWMREKIRREEIEQIKRIHP